MRWKPDKEVPKKWEQNIDGLMETLLALLDRGVENMDTTSRWRQRWVLPRVGRLEQSVYGLRLAAMGPSTSGKSTLARDLNGLGVPGGFLVTRDEFPGLRPDIRHIHETARPGSEIWDLGEQWLARTKMDSDVEGEIDQALDFLERIQEADGRTIPFKHILAYRGRTDTLAFSRFMTSFKRGSIIESEERWQRRNAYKIGTWMSSLIHSTNLDAVVLIGVSYEEAQRRRLKQGKSRYGKVVNDTVWPRVAAGYNWWLRVIYPWLRENFGTGLCIVDGEKPYEENLHRVQRYITKCAELHYQKNKYLFDL